MKRVLIVGGDSLIGRYLIAVLRDRGCHVSWTTRRPGARQTATFALDLATDDPWTVRLPSVDVVIFAAAMPGFANCRENPLRAHRVNVEAPVAIARRLAEQGSVSILVSTSAVFDGSRPHRPANEPTSATTLYGQMKAAAESGFLSLGRHGRVVRLTKVLSPENTLFRGWIEALQNETLVTAFGDLRFAAIALEDVAAAVSASMSEEGIFQASGTEDISYHEALVWIAKRLGRPPSPTSCVSAAERGIPAGERPLYTTLDTQRLSALTGWASPDPYHVLERVLFRSNPGALVDSRGLTNLPRRDLP